MDHEVTTEPINRPPLRTFRVRTLTADGLGSEDHDVVAHLVFNNKDRGDGLVFRRYYDDSVRTEKVAEFNDWLYYKEISSNG